MNSLYRTQKWKKQSERTAKRNLAKKRKLKNKIKLKVSLPHKHGDTLRLVAPSDFSILTNPNAVLVFCMQIEAAIEQRKGKVFLDMSQITNLGFDALLYLLSRFKFYKQKGVFYHLQGNIPNEPSCKRLFNDSGFYNYVNTSAKTGINDDVFSIQSGTQSEPEFAKKAVDFVRKSLSLSQTKALEGIYESLVESMSNTKQHAYSERAPVRAWWLAAYHNIEEQKVYFYFLDNGLGIPYTIRKSLTESWKQKIGIRIDSFLIQSALKGEFRSETELENRGNGLPQIYNHFRSGHIQDLNIISNRGHVNVGNMTKPQDNLAYEGFKGSFLSWSYEAK